MLLVYYLYNHETNWESPFVDKLVIMVYDRVKRGRGSIGPKMDEPFPCLPVTELPTTSDTGDRKLVVQPERWPLLRHNTDSSSSSSEEEAHGRTHRKRKEHKQKLSKRHKSKDKKRDRKEKRREKKRRKHGRD